MVTKGFLLFFLLVGNAYGENTESVLPIQKSQNQKIAPSSYYASIDLTHLNNSYVDIGDGIYRDEPSVHARLRAGMRLYDNKLDLFVLGGVIKVPKTQKLIGRRTQIELDYFPFLNEYGYLVHYQQVKLPSSEDEYDPDNSIPQKQGVIYKTGASPVAMYPISNDYGLTKLSAGVDFWTFLYSRRQYIESDEDMQPISLDEAEASPLQVRYMAGFEFKPNYLKELKVKGMVYLADDHLPSYFEEEGRMVYRYKKDRFSFYRIQASFQISEKVSISNDFYHFHEGFFEARRNSNEKKTYRNIARIKCLL